MNMMGTTPMHGMSMSSGMVGGIATLVTSFVCKKLQLNMMQFGIVYSVVLGSLSWLSEFNAPSEIRTVMSYFITFFSWIATFKLTLMIFGSVCGLTGVVYGIRRYLEFKRNTSDSINTIVFHSSTHVDQILKYFQKCKQVLGSAYDSSLGTSEVEYLFHKAWMDHDEYGQKHYRNLYLPQNGKFVKYEDVNIGIKANVRLNCSEKTFKKTIGDGDKKREETKQVILINIEFYIQGSFHPF